MLVKNSWKLSINLFDLKISLQGMTRGYFNKHKLQRHRFQYNTDIRHEPGLHTLNLTLQAGMHTALSLLPKHYLRLASWIKEHICTQSPCIPDMPQRAQSGRRTSFGIRVWFIESYIKLNLFSIYFVTLCNNGFVQNYTGSLQYQLLSAINTNIHTSDVWLTVHRNSVWIRKTN